MAEYKVAYYHEQGASVIVEAESEIKALANVREMLEEDGVEILEQMLSHKTIHRDYDVLEVEKVK